MNVVLENAWRRAVISDAGAELKSLYDRRTGTEYLWSGDPAWWSGTAPVLFPIVGGLKDGGYVHDGRRYPMPQHGFARRSRFTLEDRSPSRAVFSLAASDDTRAIYPFDFVLTATFALDHAGLAVAYEVRNTGKGAMWFSLGSHPAFRLPLDEATRENHYFWFSAPEKNERFFFAEGLILPETAPVFASSRVISLSRRLFDRGPVILKQPVSEAVTLMNSRGRTRITLTTGDAPFLALWSKPGGAPFVCIEPWYGLPDRPDATGSLADKEGIRTLEAGARWQGGYRMDVDS